MASSETIRAAKIGAWASLGVALIGGAITVIVALINHQPSSSASAATTPAPTSSGHAAAPAPVPSTTEPVSPPSAAKVRYSGKVSVDTGFAGYDSRVDLDSSPPLVANQDGWDVWLVPTSDAPDLTTSGGVTVAQLPSGGEPTEAQCLSQVQSHQAGNPTAKSGSRFCALTSEGRIAYLNVVVAPSSGNGQIRLAVTVWDPPA